MNHIESLTRYVANFVDELVQGGLTEVVISPGSRSTPLAMTMCEHEGINEWTLVDERSAAFFALGIAKKQQKPVAILCTSGTAAANYYPAIVEAYYSRVPLIVLTTDRPHELRDVGAPQAIDQLNMFQNYVKWSQEMALPESTPRMLGYIRSKAARAIAVSREGNAGPVHLNFPFREPLIPDFQLENIWGDRKQVAYHPTIQGEKRLSPLELEIVLEQIENKKKGLIVCGPQIDEQLAPSIVALASKWNVPVLADPLSQLRSGEHEKHCIIENYDSMLRSEAIREQLKPDYIIRFGAMPVSKSYLFYVEEHGSIPQFIIEEEEGFRDPTGNESTMIYADPKTLCADLMAEDRQGIIDPAWLNKWQQMNEKAKGHINKPFTTLTEGTTVRSLLHIIPTSSTLYVGNSMAIRDLDTFFTTRSKSISILANRGANGIDGMVSSGLGAAVMNEHPTTLLLGDLSFYHDLNGLLAAKQYDIPLTILLINNNGGGIFSYLPQAKDEKHFESLFGTPLNIEFEPVVSMYGGVYERASNKDELEAALISSYQRNKLTVIEVQTDRRENMNWHKQIWSEIESDLLKLED